MPITEIADIGAFTSVPLQFSDGRLYGTLCAASHDAKPRSATASCSSFTSSRGSSPTNSSATRSGPRAELESQASAAATLIAAVDARDSYTGEHSQAVVEHAGAVARDLGLSASEVRKVELAALLHDIGKIAIPDAILRRPGRSPTRSGR